MKILAIQTHYRKVDKNGRKVTAMSSVDWWRVVNPMRHLQKLCPDWEIDIRDVLVDENGDVDAQFQEVGKTYDLIFTSYIDNPKGYAWLRALSERFDVPLVMDIDDNLYDVDENSPVYEEYHPGSLKLFYCSTILRDVDYLTVSTGPLRHVYRNKRPDNRPDPVIMPNGIDLGLYAHPRLKGLPRDRGTVKIGWWGGWTHYSDIAMVENAIKRILEKYPHVTFETVGMISDLLENVPRATQRLGSATFDKWVKVWQGFQFDIAICPITGTEFNNGKSDIKWQEAAAARMPVVASDYGPYARAIEHGKTGLLAKTEDEWVEHLSTLIEDREMRVRLADAALEEVRENKAIVNVAEKYRDYFLSIVDAPRPWMERLDVPSEEEKPKVLTLGDVGE